MDAETLRTEMLRSLAISMKNLLDERKLTNSGPYYAELTGRLDAMRTLVDYLMNADTTPVVKGCEECGGECQGHPDSGGEEEGEAK